jgi:hemoglobin
MTGRARKARAWRAVVVAVAGLALAACTTTTAAKPPSLYQRLGGREGIRGVVDDFVATAAADDRIKDRFAGLPPARVEQLKTHLSDQICEATGGPCSYLGRDMKATHQGMKISDAEWTATVEDLVKAMDKRKVAPEDQQALLGLLGPMKADIVGQ